MAQVIIIVGPTGIGKTKLSIELAKYYNCEIISGDSIQVYRGLDIGSAKVLPEEMEGIKHHLIDCNDVNEPYSVADFQKKAREIINQKLANNENIIIAGGTGLYIKACLYDYNFSENNVIETTKYDHLDNDQLFELLQSIDYDASLKTHPNNRKRVMRALNIYEATQKKPSDIIKDQNQEPIYPYTIIGLTQERSLVYDIINQRVDKMIACGLVEEMKQFYDQDNYHSIAFQGIGYKELIPYFKAEMSLEECVEKIKQNSRRLAKKQWTWFNNQMHVNWINVNLEDFNQTIEQAKLIIGSDENGRSI